MSLRVVHTSEALQDITLQADYYAAKENVVLAERFIESLKRTVQMLSVHPLLGKLAGYRHPKLTGIRFFLVRRPFEQHLIFYRIHHEQLDIVRVLHGKRDLPRRIIEPPNAPGI